ncbi:MAG: hypothetical protein PHW52_01565 [Candidatus Pacebacteria bacterium]|nr:hypothetical protein [Candidatus Paceibacterota bacterium]
MIVREEAGDIFKTQCKHIMFAVNVEGVNDCGFAGQVSSHYWPEISCTMPSPLGTVFSAEKNGKTFHAIVCHSLCVGGWKETPKVLRGCLDNLAVPDEERIASVLIGGGFVGQAIGANVSDIINAMDQSRKSIVLYFK